MLFKLSLILLISVSVSFAARPVLRSESVFRPAELLKVIKNQLSFVMPLPEEPLNLKECDELNGFAQALAEQNGNPINFIDSYTQSSEHVLTFGLKLRGNTTLETILLGDSTLVSDHMSGFLDFRYKDAKLNIVAKEIRESIQIGRCFTPTHYSLKNCAPYRLLKGSLNVASEIFNYNLKLTSLRDLLNVMTLYDEFVKSQVKLTDSNGNIPLGFRPATLNLDLHNVAVNVETRKNHIVPLHVDPNWSQDDLLEEIDNHFRVLVEDSTVEALEIPSALESYGFGISVDSNDDITIVYTFGGKNRPAKSNKKLYDFYKDLVYVTPNGKTLDFNPFVKKSHYEMQRISNQYVINTVNYQRVRKNLPPLRLADPKLYKLTQTEADRSAAAGRFVEPSFRGISENTVLYGTSFFGKTTVKEFVLASQKSVGKTVCFDNFSNSQPRTYSLFETYGNICNNKFVEKFSKFENIGSGIGWNANGDVYSFVALSESQ